MRLMSWKSSFHAFLTQMKKTTGGACYSNADRLNCKAETELELLFWKVS